ncbi:hypothetical protein DXG01_011482 [Tephrocybe rancida]|nr:hypothetical protein DXG01_011482 [Tephrocybe rancida]
MLPTLCFLVSAPGLLASAAGAPGDGWNPTHPNGETTKCEQLVHLSSTKSFIIFDCKGSPAQQWNISPGNTTVRICVSRSRPDAASNPVNGGGMKIWECFEAASSVALSYFETPATWVEISDEPISAVVSDDSETESGTESGMTSVPNSSERYLPTNGGGPTIDFDDLTDRPSLSSKSSFPVFTLTVHRLLVLESQASDDEALGNVFTLPVTPPPMQPRAFYTQMEFVERQTLKERIDEEITRDEARQLFQQIVDALAHISTLSILHRDIKLTNIFIG